LATISLHPATPDDARELAGSMREQDAREVRATGYEPEAALLTSMRVSAEAWTVRCDDVIMCMWGVVDIDLLDGVATPWLLTSPLVERHQKTFVKLAIKTVNELRLRYRLLVNTVDARHVMAVRWLRRMGFELGDCPAAAGVHGEKFYQINIKGL